MDETEDSNATFSRREPRFAQQGATATLAVDGARQELRLANLSLSGASGSCAKPPRIGAVVELTFRNGRQMIGRVRWVRESLIGIEFMGRLPLDMLRAPAAGHRNRAPRYRVAREATVAANGGLRPAVIRNVSVLGMMIETGFSLMPGQSIEIRTGALAPIVGQVRWARNGRAGVQLAQALSIAEFDAGSGPAAS